MTCDLLWQRRTEEEVDVLLTLSSIYGKLLMTRTHGSGWDHAVVRLGWVNLGLIFPLFLRDIGSSHKKFKYSLKIISRHYLISNIFSHLFPPLHTPPRPRHSQPAVRHRKWREIIFKYPGRVTQIRPPTTSPTPQSCFRWVNLMYVNDLDKDLVNKVNGWVVILF